MLSHYSAAVEPDCRTVAWRFLNPSTEMWETLLIWTCPFLHIYSGNFWVSLYSKYIVLIP